MTGFNRNSSECVPKRMLDWWLTVLFCTLALSSPLFAADSYPVEIQGSSRGGEKYETTFTAFIADRPVRESEHGYTPVAIGVDGKPIKTKYYTPLELTWDFGDGSVVTIHDRVSASHQYNEDGQYTVTVVARDTVGEFARASHEITISNNDPANARVAATVIDASQQLVEFSAWVEDAPGDPMQLHWDFGDGDTAQGNADEIWWTRHQYVLPGRYTATLTITDDDYPWSSATSSERNDGEFKKSVTIDVGGGDSIESPEREQVDDRSDTVELTRRLNGEMTGALKTHINGDIRPFAGLYLSRVKSGACRFMFTFRDDAQLMHGLAVVDLHGVPPEGGRFRIDKPQFSFEFQPDAEKYRAQLNRTPAGLGFGGRGVAGLVNQALNSATTPDGAALSEEQRQAVTTSLKDKTGIDSQPLPDRPKAIMPSQSPIVDDSVRFRTIGGELVLDFIPGDRAVGHFDVEMEANSGPMKGQLIQVSADLAMNMQAAASDGIVRYDGCEPPPFEVKRVWPNDGFEHLLPKHPPVWVGFSDQVDPETLDEKNVQITYVATDGAAVPVAIRILRHHDGVHIIPEQPLLPGVSYKIRIKAGPDGVRSRKGSPLEPDDDSDWYTSLFTTRVDMTPITNESRLLACHIYQPVRDVPLIVGKPAVARIFASWEKQPGVHPDHQVAEFNAQVELYGPDNRIVGQQSVKFVRPDLWSKRGVNAKTADHSAQLAFTPTEDMQGPLLSILRVAQAPGEDGAQYRAKCPLKLWDRQPTLSIDFVALPIDEWKNDPMQLQTLLPTLQQVADAGVEHAMEQLPLAGITATPVRVLPLAVDIPPLRPPDTPSFYKCEASCITDGYPDDLNSDLANKGWPGFGGIGSWLSSQSSADVIIAFGPHLRLTGGVASAKLREGRGVVLVLGSNDEGYFPRYVNGVVHELGHVLGLDHLPYVKDDNNRARVVPLRDGNPPFWYEGIEALRINTDGQTTWNKSSTEGNEQGEKLFPLMFPGTIPVDDAFIANHHYRQIQVLLEELNR